MEHNFPTDGPGLWRRDSFLDDLSAFHVFMCLFLAVLGLCCCLGFSPLVAIGGYTRVVVHRLLIAVASFAVEL